MFASVLAIILGRLLVARFDVEPSENCFENDVNPDDTGIFDKNQFIVFGSSLADTGLCVFMITMIGSVLNRKNLRTVNIWRGPYRRKFFDIKIRRY